MQYDDRRPTPVPISIQPKGTAYFLKTWSGRLILINTIVFLAMSLESGSFTMPTTEVLLRYGAKDPVGLARGEYWRFFAPMFVHIGVIHFAFNTAGIYWIGYQIENILGPRWFIFLYLLAGTAGNVASGFSSLHISAGASGALFGLLGSGFYLEHKLRDRIYHTTGYRPKGRGVYTSMVLINVILGLLIPAIDNAAHLGGLFTGMTVTYAILRLRPNRLTLPNPFLGRLILASYVGVVVMMGMWCLDADYTTERFLEQARPLGADQLASKHDLYSKAAEISPENIEARIGRLKIYLIVGDFDYASVEMARIERIQGGPQELQTLKNGWGQSQDQRVKDWFQQNLPNQT